MVINPKLKWVGWIMCLPIAAISYLIGYALYKLLIWFTFKLNWQISEDSWFIKYFAHGVASGLGGYCFIVFGILVTPTYKRQTALILLLLFTFLMGMGAFAGILKEHSLSIIEAIGGIIGAALGYLKVRDDND